jgi:haloalkane dehalogenase
MQGIGNPDATPREEIDAYVDLLKRKDGGLAFLAIMRRFERTREKRDLYVGAVRDVPYPVQVVWGVDDPALKVETQGEEVRRAAGLDEIHALPAKHFLQEDQAPAIAKLVAEIAGR